MCVGGCVGADERELVLALRGVVVAGGDGVFVVGDFHGLGGLAVGLATLVVGQAVLPECPCEGCLGALADAGVVNDGLLYGAFVGAGKLASRAGGGPEAGELAVVAVHIVVGGLEGNSAVAGAGGYEYRGVNLVVVDGDLVANRAAAVGAAYCPREGDAVAGNALHCGVGVGVVGREGDILRVAVLDGPLAHRAGDGLAVEHVLVATGAGGLAFYLGVGVNTEHGVVDSEFGEVAAYFLAVHLAPYVPMEHVLAGNVEVRSGGAVAAAVGDGHVVGTAHHEVLGPLAVYVVAKVADGVGYEFRLGRAGYRAGHLLAVDGSVCLVVGHFDGLGVVALAALALGYCPDELLALVDFDAGGGGLVLCRAVGGYVESGRRSPLAAGVSVNDGLGLELDGAVAGNCLVEYVASLDVVVLDDNLGVGVAVFVALAVDGPEEGVAVAVESGVRYLGAGGGGLVGGGALDYRARGGGPLADDVVLKRTGAEGDFAVADLLLGVGHGYLGYAGNDVVDGGGGDVGGASVGVLDGPGDAVLAVGEAAYRYLAVVAGLNRLERQAAASPLAGVSAVVRHRAFDHEVVVADVGRSLDFGDEPVVDDRGLNAVGAGRVGGYLHYVAELGLRVVLDVVYLDVAYAVVFDARYVLGAAERAGVGVGDFLPVALRAAHDVAGLEFGGAVAGVVDDVGSGLGLYVDEGDVVGSLAAVGGCLLVVEADGGLATHAYQDGAVVALGVGSTLPFDGAASLCGGRLYCNNVVADLAGLGLVVGVLVGVNREAVRADGEDVGRLLAALARLGNLGGRRHYPLELVVAALEVACVGLVVVRAVEGDTGVVDAANTLPFALAAGRYRRANEFYLVVAGNVLAALDVGVGYLRRYVEALVGDLDALLVVGAGEAEFVVDVLCVPLEGYGGALRQCYRDGRLLAACRDGGVHSRVVGCPPALHVVDLPDVLGVEVDGVAADGLARSLDEVLVVLVEDFNRLGNVCAGAVLVGDGPGEGGGGVSGQVGYRHNVVGVGAARVGDGRGRKRPLALAGDRRVGGEVDVCLAGNACNGVDYSVVNVVVGDDNSGGLGTAVVVGVEREGVLRRLGEAARNGLVDHAASDLVGLAVALAECYAGHARLPPALCVGRCVGTDERELVLTLCGVVVAGGEGVIVVGNPYSSLRLAYLRTKVVVEVEDEVNACIAVDTREGSRLASGGLVAIGISCLRARPVTISLGLPSSNQVVVERIRSGEFHAVVAYRVCAVVETCSIHCDKRHNLVVIEFYGSRLRTVGSLARERPLERYTSVRDIVDNRVPSVGAYDVACIESIGEYCPCAVGILVRRSLHLCRCATDADVG